MAEIQPIIKEAINDLWIATRKLREIDEKLFLNEDSVLEYITHARGQLERIETEKLLPWR